MVRLAQEDAQLVCSVAEVGEETSLHVQNRHAGSVAAKVDRGDDTARWGVDGNGQGAEADLVLLIAEGVAVATDVA